MSVSRRTYMDNAATSFPKPIGVLEAMNHYATHLGASPGRGAYAEARQAGQLLYQCRDRINQLIGGEDPNHVIFTLNTTDGLNLAISGLLHHAAAQTYKSRKIHVITTWLDHNSVLRPLNLFTGFDWIRQTRVTCDAQSGLVDPEDVRKAIRSDTALIVVVHGSNVTGSLQPIRSIGQIAREHKIPFLVDAAQTVGHVPIHVQNDCIDLLAFPGHKGLLGPLGTGALYIKPGIERIMTTVKAGGTGSVSENDHQPDFLPDRFETGSHNAIGIIGLSEGLKWILDKGIDNLWRHEQALCAAMIEGLTGNGKMPWLRLYGPQGIKHRCAVFSVRIEGYDSPQMLSDILENEYGILTRSGIHCAPLAHETIGTRTIGGTTRFSFGPFNTIHDVQYACDALGHICHKHALVTQ